MLHKNDDLLYRAATPDHIGQMHVVRMSVTENTLSDPTLVTPADYLEFIEERGRGWVCMQDGVVVGFAIIDLQDHNIWALFVHPQAAGRGIGRTLHHTMLSWYFQQSHHPLWLGTTPNTRAEYFYKKAGWQPAGMHGTHEVKFEMSYAQWMAMM